MWLLWGREVAGAGLDTREGPAFKPLPVAVCALLAPLGTAAPVVWVLLVRTAGVLAVQLAWRAGRRLAGGSRPPGALAAAAGLLGGRLVGLPAPGAGLAGALAAAAVLLCGRLIGFTASGAEPALVLAAALGGLEAWAAGRPRLALACAAACGLLRVEAWPFLLAGGVVLWRRAPQHRPALGLAAVLVPAAWFVPEWLGSGELLRAAARARVPNPGQPAVAAVPALASLRAGLALVPWALWAGLAALAVAAARERRTVTGERLPPFQRRPRPARGCSSPPPAPRGSWSSRSWRRPGSPGSLAMSCRARRCSASRVASASAAWPRARPSALRRARTRPAPGRRAHPGTWRRRPPWGLRAGPAARPRAQSRSARHSCSPCRRRSRSRTFPRCTPAKGTSGASRRSSPTRSARRAAPPPGLAAGPPTPGPPPGPGRAPPLPPARAPPRPRAPP